MLLDGLKFSTSKGHAIWVEDAAKIFNTRELRQFIARHHAREAGISMNSGDLHSLGKSLHSNRRSPAKSEVPEALLPRQDIFSLRRAAEEGYEC